MAAITQLGNLEATVSGGIWTTQDKDVAAVLNTLSEVLLPDGPSGADPNPDHSLANLVAKELGGTVTHFDPVERVPGRIY